MELKRYVELVQRWLWLLVLGTLLASVTALVTSKLQKPIYQASATLLISEAPSNTLSEYNAILTSERLARTYTQIMTSRPVIQEVIVRLGLNTNVEDLIKTIRVEVIRDTQLIKVSAEGTDPSQVAAVANALPEVFRDYNETTQAGRFAESKQSLSAEIAKLDQLIIDSQNQIQALGQPTDVEGQAQLDRLQADLSQLRQSRTGLLQSYENLRLAEAQSLNNVIVVEPASAPEKPIRPRTLVNVALAAVVGLMLSLGIAFLIEYLDDAIKDPDQVTSLLGVPVLGVLARLSKEDLQQGLIAKVKPRAPATEAFRALRTNLQFAGIDRPLRRILVTSVGPGEGKSTMVANLAMVVAQAGHRVAVLDADLRRPSQNKLLEQSNRFGLSELMLQEPLHLDGALQPAGLPNLFLLSTGKLPPNPAELLGSNKMSSLMDLLNDRVDLILVDSPPALVVTDALALASKVDGVILVIEAGKTQAAAALQVKEQLQRLGANVLGVVLNKVPLRRGSYAYNNYYYYYSHYSESEAPGNKRKIFPLSLLANLKPKNGKHPIEATSKKKHDESLSH